MKYLISDLAKINIVATLQKDEISEFIRVGSLIIRPLMDEYEIEGIICPFTAAEALAVCRVEVLLKIPAVIAA